MRTLNRFSASALLITAIVASLAAGSASAGVKDKIATDIIVETDNGKQTFAREYQNSTDRLLAAQIVSKIYQTENVDFRDTIVCLE